jgi:outer membrane phospholipase A
MRRDSAFHRPSPLAKLLGGSLLLAAASSTAYADVTVVSPPTVVAASQPMRVTLMFAEDADSRTKAGTPGAQTSVHYAVPPTLRVAVASGDLPPQTLTLTRDPAAPAALSLRPGQFRRISYTTSWPAEARGTVRVQVADFNASPALVTLDRGKQQDLTIAANQAAREIGPGATAVVAAPGGAADSANAAGQAGTVATTQDASHGPSPTLPNATPGTAASPTATTATGTVPANDTSIGQQQAAIAATSPESRLSFYEPMYIEAGRNGHTTARFQLSFKYRIVKPADPRSRGFLDNLYFGYTQVSIWDLTADSKPFRDTSYKPSIFYYLADTGLRSRWFDSLGFQGGIEHESNGQAGDSSRSINIAYVQPIVHFSMPWATQLTLAPKIYYYLQNSENSDIAKYRGYTDFQIRYGRPDGLELFTTLRKGNHAMYGSIDAQLSYPVQRLFGGALGGYLSLGYFNGYGQSLLDYNNRQHWIVRVGYSIYR